MSQGRTKFDSGEMAALALPAPAATAWNREMKPIEIIMACGAGRISIGEWAVLGSNQ
jgi:hypothetical protein